MEGHADYGNGLLLGHCCQWHSVAPKAGMESSPAIGAEINPNDRFTTTRLRALDTTLTPGLLLTFAAAQELLHIGEIHLPIVRTDAY